jgi:hypothetical protein
MATAHHRLAQHLAAAGIEAPPSFFTSLPPATSSFLTKTLENIPDARCSNPKGSLQQRDAPARESLPDTAFQQDQQSSNNGWLSGSVQGDIEKELQNARQSGAMLQAQLGDMQALGQGIEFRLRHARTMHQASEAQHTRDASALSSKRAALSSLNSRLNQLLEELQSSIRVSTQVVHRFADQLVCNCP